MPSPVKERAWNDEFLSLYADLKGTDPNLIAVPQETLDRIADELSREYVTYETHTYIQAAILATVSITLVTVLIAGCWRLTGTYLQQLVYLVIHPNLSADTALFFAFVTVTYALLVPAFLNWNAKAAGHPALVHLTAEAARHKLPLPQDRFIVDMTSTRYRVFLGLELYLAFPAIFAAILHADHHYHGLLIRSFVTLWLVPLCMLVAILATIPIVYLTRVGRPHRETHQFIALSILRIINKLDGVKTFAGQRYEDRGDLIQSIRICAARIYRLYPEVQDPTGYWAKEQLTLAKYNFLSLAAWVYFPQDGTIGSLRNAPRSLSKRLCIGESARASAR